ncbi:MAG: methyltransferase domain-containing protein [Asgard group archaeon]|nr:methyltransferase domain-containing protein [Asgard group archaeon]
MTTPPKKSKKSNYAKFILQLLIKRTHKIEIKSIPENSVIDIGGGGEGIIAQIGRDRITVVDKLQSEIDEAQHKAPEAKWILADARNLKFSDGQFDSATAFFSIMYMSNEDKREVFKEVYRVISQKGEFWIWDASIAKEEGVFLIKIKVIFPDKTAVRTAYGVPSKKQNAELTKEMLQAIGFKVKLTEIHKHWYLLKAKK